MNATRITSVLFTRSLNSHLEADIYRKIELTRGMEADAMQRDRLSFIYMYAVPPVLYIYVYIYISMYIAIYIYT